MIMGFVYIIALVIFFVWLVKYLRKVIDKINADCKIKLNTL